MHNTIKSTAVCAICGKVHPVSKMGEFCGKRFCPHCLSVETFICACCRRRMPRSEIAARDSDNAVICQDCFDNYFTRCDACGLLIRQPEAHWCMVGGYERPYCSTCLRKMRGGSLFRAVETVPPGSDPKPVPNADN